MQYLNNKKQLFDLLDKGFAVLTPNNRLSEDILRQYFIHGNTKTVKKPICLPFSIALSKAYEDILFNSQTSASHPTLLNSAQCRYLWQELIKEQSHITYSEGLNDAVIRAWEHCQQWEIELNHSAFHYTAQTRQFQSWWRLFEKQLKQQQLITECQLISYLIEQNTHLFSQPIIWACFDDFNPQQKRLQRHLIAQGLVQYVYDLPEQKNSAQIFTAKNDKEEYLQLTYWLQQQLQKNNSRIGVVVPDLHQKLMILPRILEQHIEPSLFNISLGQPLSQFPLVAHALCWLNQETNYISSHQASLFLQSPYVGGAHEEFLARSEYLQEAILLENHFISWPRFIQDLQNQAPKLAALLSQIVDYPQEALINEWLVLFQERLGHLGFPGKGTLSSENYQCLKRFYLLFDELRQFSVFKLCLKKSEVLALLQQLTENTIFQARKNHAPIQISGLLEASGCEFDSLWVMGLTDQCLPQKVSLSAFIPVQLQRELNMPHSNPARELQFAQQILDRLRNSAQEVVFSYAKLQGDTPHLPCSLINMLPQVSPLTTTEVIVQHLIKMNDEYMIPISESEQISGGTAILASQAKCPFKAFADHRLRAKASSFITEGLDAKERGRIIHKVMELLWKTLEHQQRLFTLDKVCLEEQIDQAIHTALASLKQLESFSTIAQEVEYIRLKRLVHTSLDWEKQRPAFTVAALEQAYTINLAGLDFQVRVDRLDQVADKKWVIDYKSSLPNSKPWYEERPKEPQLLLYALLDSQINTLFLMQLKTGKISCIGLSEEKQDILGVACLKKDETWERSRSHWQAQLTLLAQEFKQGYCPPQPAQNTICQQCDYQSLCRFQKAEISAESVI